MLTQGVPIISCVRISLYVNVFVSVHLNLFTIFVVIYSEFTISNFLPCDFLKNASTARVSAFNAVNVGKCFNMHDDLYEKHKYPPHRIYNCYETGVMTVPNKPSKVFSKMVKNIKLRKRIQCLG